MEKILQCSCLAGRMLLESGAETYRVEDTMVRLCKAYGGTEIDSFVLPTGIFFSFVIGDQSYSKNIRVHDRNTDLNRIDRINELSRRASEHKITVDELYNELCGLQEKDEYPIAGRLLFACIGAGGFALFFQASLIEALCACICGFCIKLIQIGLGKLQVSSFIGNSLGGAAATFLALSFSLIIHDLSADTVIISSIMLLVPGIAITNAIKDSIAGDLVSGMSRAMEAFLIAVSIALGAGAVLGVWMTWMGGV